jgi:hypothetical protein
MSDYQCIGVCMMDPETGACMGCGRLPDESAGAPQPVPKTSERVPLPPQVAAEAQNPTD